MWEEVLRIPRVGANDNFFELGGHSLLAAGVMSRVRERYNIALPLRTIFEAPTLAAFASRIETMLWASRNVESVRDSSQAREEIEL
jgi:acyl carrier protein